MPLLGFGVYLNDGASMSKALKAGYRHIDTAQCYQNEAEVGEAVESSDLSREDIFISEPDPAPSALRPGYRVIDR